MQEPLVCRLLDSMYVWIAAIGQDKEAVGKLCGETEKQKVGELAFPQSTVSLPMQSQYAIKNADFELLVAQTATF